MLFLLSFLAVAFGQECTDGGNLPFLNLNPDCNFAGTCIDDICYCCELSEKTLRAETYDGIPDCPGWNGGKYDNGDQGPCTSQTEFASVTWKYYFPASQNYDCSDSGATDALALEIEDFYTRMGYDGVVVRMTCRECDGGSPCRFYDHENSSNFDDYTNGVEFEVGTDLHTFYDPLCFNPSDPVPSIYNQNRCAANFDQGYLAYFAFKRVKMYNSAQPDEWNGDGTADFKAINTALGTGITQSSFTVILNNKKVSIRTLSPTSAPSPIPTTPDPTDAPTVVPSVGDICFSKGYTNKLEDLKYMGNGDNCRAGIKMEWPGKRSCNSPYIVCLPLENTPNQTPKDPFYDRTHRYTVDQCKFECTWDQRCRGFEFKADAGKSTGQCTLIDDLPLEIENPGSYVYDDTDTDLNQYDSLCFQKQDYCNPFFEAEDLEQTMIDCYCPNNRKGFYTKKVKRTVANTRFCGSDADTDRRIQQAQANRMFHLCENWCLFNTFKPEQESWYWNPWRKCWREQYAGTGMHRSYCNRVIRNPDTIEQYFINYRRDNFCAPRTPMPTGRPSDLGFRWFLAQEEESCSDACDSRGRVCSEAGTASLGETTSERDLGDAFTEAGFTCASYGVARKDYAAPAVDSMGKCLRRHDMTEANTGCNWATGVGYQRLCACSD